jgi:hypothetical protein
MCDVAWRLGDFDDARRREGQEDMILVAEAVNGREAIRVQLGSKTRPFCRFFGGLIAVRATESMGLRV